MIGKLALPILLALLPALHAASAEERPHTDVTAVLLNKNGKDFENLPVFIPVHAVLGRGMDYATISKENFQVFDEQGSEVEYMYRPMPPYFSPANDELVFFLPQLRKDQQVRYRFTYGNKPASKQVPWDAGRLADHPGNWVHNGGFERGLEHWAGTGQIVGDITHSGMKALLLTAQPGGKAEVTLGRKFTFNPDGRYYFCAWAKSENVARYSYRNKDAGGRIDLVNEPFKGELYPVVDTRDWHCYRPADRRLESVEPTPAHWNVLAPSFPMVGKFRDAKAEKKNQVSAAHQNGYASGLTLSLNQVEADYLEKGKPGRIWLDEILLFDQPAVVFDLDAELREAGLDKPFVYARSVTHFGPRVRANERAERIESAALRGERHTVSLGVSLPAGAAELSLELSDWEGPQAWHQADREVEYQVRTWAEDLTDEEKWAHDLEGPLKGLKPGHVDFFVAQRIPRDAKAGLYRCTAQVKVNGAIVGALPIGVNVGDVPLKIVTDRFVGAIFNQRPVAKPDEFLKYYSRSNFTYLMWFARWLPFQKGKGVDLDRLVEKMKTARDVGGLSAGVGLYWDCALDHYGRDGLWGKVGRDKEKYRQAVMQIDRRLAEAKLPRIVYMIWDEPKSVSDAFGILKGTGAYTTCDAMGRPFFDTLEHITHVSYDDPCEEYGPSLYRYLNARGVKHGFCGSAFRPTASRYQVGLGLAAANAQYWHQWHLVNFYKLSPQDQKWCRTRVAIAMGEGMNDLRYHDTLKAAIAHARQCGKATDLALEAERYLAQVFAFCSGDIGEGVNPYNGSPEEWGDDRFYDRWRAQVRQYILGIRAQAGAWPE